MRSSNDRPVRLREAARLLGIAPVALLELARDGAVPSLLVGGSLIFSMAAVERALARLAGGDEGAR